MKVRITFNDTKFEDKDKGFIKKFIKLLQEKYPLKDEVTIKFLGKQIGSMSTGSRTNNSELKYYNEKHQSNYCHNLYTVKFICC